MSLNSAIFSDILDKSAFLINIDGGEKRLALQRSYRQSRSERYWGPHRKERRCNALQKCNVLGANFMGVRKCSMTVGHNIAEQWTHFFEKCGVREKLGTTKNV